MSAVGFPTVSQKENVSPLLTTVPFKIDVVMPMLRLLGVPLPPSLVEKVASSCSSDWVASCAPILISFLVVLFPRIYTVILNSNITT